MPMNSKLELVTAKIRQLINSAPAGGVFHDAETHGEKTLHLGYANEQRYFFIDTSDNHRFFVTVEEVQTKGTT